jgi:hypothetical protein
MKEPRKHHFISKCYLKGFTSDGTEEGDVFAINVDKGNSFITNIDDAGVQRDFNAIEGLPAGLLEKRIAKVESVIAPALARMIDAQSIDNRDDWNAFLNLVAMFAVRNPRIRNVMERFASDTMNIITQVMLATPEIWASQVEQMNKMGLINQDHANVSYEEIKRAKDDLVGWKLSRGFHIDMEFAGSIEQLLYTLINRKWTLMTAQGEAGSFITTDHPVCLSHNDGSRGSFEEPVVHAMPKTCVLLPVSKDLVAVGTFEGKSAKVEATRVQVARLNSLIAQHAKDHIYSANDQFPIWLGRNYKAIGADVGDFIKQSAKT